MTVYSTFKITLEIAGPFLCSATVPASWGLNASFDRNYEGKPYIDSSHLKGKLLEAVKELGLPVKTISDWFGKEGEFENGRIAFPNLFLCDKDFETQLTQSLAAARITRIRMDEDRGAVDNNALLAVENAFPPAKDKIYAWYGEPSYYAVDADEAKNIAKNITLGLKWIGAFGAEKGVGFGQLKKVMVSDPHITEINLTGSYQTSGAAAETLTLKIDAEEPLLLGDVKIKANYQDSMSYIQGSVIKGAMARALNDACGVPRPAATPVTEANAKVKAAFPLLTKYFGLLRITHAYPSTTPKRPTIIPFSAVIQGDAHYDVALLEGPQPINGRAPVFQTDWKPADYPADFGWAEPRKHVKTRTAIDSELRRADDGSMFTYQYICPDNGRDKITWLSEISLAAVPEAERLQLQAELRQAFGLLRYLGKRDSRVEVAMMQGAPETTLGEGEVLLSSKRAIVTLQSDALMVDPAALKNNQTADKLKELYAAFWAEVSNGSLELERFFACQKLRGGYLSTRVQPKEYYPYFLTTAGSVFVLKARDEGSARERLTAWKKKGLALPGWAVEQYGEPVWKKCPFVPENGFGEIRVNLKWHAEHAPGKGGDK